MKPWFFYLLSSSDRVIARRNTAEKIGIAWRGYDGVDDIGKTLKMRKSQELLDVGDKGEMSELDAVDALKTGLNIDRWHEA